MRRGPTVAAVFLALVPSLALAPTVALAGRLHGGAVGGHPIAGGRPFVSRPFVPHHFSPRPFCDRHFFRPFFPFGVIASPVVVFAPPPVYYAPPPTSYDPPAAYGPPADGTVWAPPPPPPPPSIIEYPTGRYELRGDGVTTPFAWVWIPKPPPPPAPPAGPPAPPEGAPADPPPIERQTSTRLYRWIDDEGVTHWTNMPNAIPERYRPEVERPLQASGDRRV